MTKICRSDSVISVEETNHQTSFKKKMNKIEISLLKKLMKLRGILDAVSQISWSFSILNKQHPVGTLTSEEAKDLIKTYEEFLDELKELLEK